MPVWHQTKTSAPYAAHTHPDQYSRWNDANILPIRGKVQMQLAAPISSLTSTSAGMPLSPSDMHRAHARGDTAALDACGGELCALPPR